MAKNQNTAEKRRREVEKKFKADEKRKNRQKKKLAGPTSASPAEYVGEIETTAEEPSE